MMWDFVGIIVIQTSMQRRGYGTKEILYTLQSLLIAYIRFLLTPIAQPRLFVEMT